MSDSLDKRYMQVASACLKALNNLNLGADQQTQIKAVYSAIDQAIGELYKQQHEELKVAKETLQKIASLNPKTDTLQDAIDLARPLLPVKH